MSVFNVRSDSAEKKENVAKNCLKSVDFETLVYVT